MDFVLQRAVQEAGARCGAKEGATKNHNNERLVQK
jgi:hypothetical protein